MDLGNGNRGAGSACAVCPPHGCPPGICHSGTPSVRCNELFENASRICHDTYVMSNYRIGIEVWLPREVAGPFNNPQSM